MMLEKELQEIIALTSQELEEHREKVLELEDEVGRASSSHSRTGLAAPVQLWCREQGSWRGRTYPVARIHTVLLCAVSPLVWVPLTNPTLLRGSPHALLSTPPEWFSEC